jgi:hypothetical protein
MPASLARVTLSGVCTSGGAMFVVGGLRYHVFTMMRS